MRRLGMLAMAGLFAFAVQQPLSAQSITLGAKAGATFATVGGDEAVSDAASNRTGLSFGATAEFGVSPLLSIQPELLFVQKGAEFADSDFGDATFNFNYLEIPVLAKISVPSAGLASPYLYVGPSISFQSGCSISSEDQGVSAELDCDNDLVDIPTNSVDFGFLGGVGLGVGMGPGEVAVDVRYNLGLADVVDTPEGEDVTSIKNRAFGVSLGYAVSLGM
ncbi:MAG: porin family protein [Gemmatimonadota bacterium]